MTLDDLANYKVANRKVLMDEYGDMTINTVPSPYAGPIVTHILNILKGNYNKNCFKRKFWKNNPQYSTNESEKK